MKQQIILFIEPAKEEWKCPESIGNLYMYLNRFAIDEDAAHEVLGVYYFQQSSPELCDPKNNLFLKNATERQQKERFDNKLIQKGLKIAAKNRSSNIQTHIFISTTSSMHEKPSKRIEYILNLIQHHRIASVLFTQFLLHRVRFNVMEEIKSAYKDDQGLILQKPEDLSKMTEEEITPVSFDWLGAHHFQKLFQRFYGDGTNVVVGKPFEYHTKTSVLNDIDELFETASISAIQDSIKSGQNCQYSFLF